MERVIRNQLWCMVGVMLGLLALGAWAHDFIIKGIMAKPALNIPIFLLFFSAAALAMRSVYKLKNEIVAMTALQVDYSPRQLIERPDPYGKPGIVFEEPSLLGMAYRLITEEMTNAGRIQLPATTVQTIITAIDHRISEKKSLISYFANLLVFLGLLGAFMGLMKTVGSVGDLIGGMDLSGSAGDGAFAALIEGMKGPLNGMSVGFSSSLFGLATSLVLGSYERFMLNAMKELRNEFESWLTNITQLESSGSESDSHAHGSSPELSLDAALQRLDRVERQLGQASQVAERSAHAVTQMAASVESLTRLLADRDDTLRQANVVALGEQIAQAQRDTMLEVTGLIAAQKGARDDVNTLLERLTAAIEQLRDSPAQQIDASAGLTDDDAMDEPAEAGARSLLDRVASAFSNGRSRAEVRQYKALVKDIAQASMVAHASLQTVMKRMEKARVADRRALISQSSVHQELVAAVTALTRRIDELAVTVRDRDTTSAEHLSEALRQARTALDSSITGLSLRLDQSPARPVERSQALAQIATQLHAATGTAGA